MSKKKAKHLDKGMAETVASKPRKPVLELILPDWQYDKVEAALKSKCLDWTDSFCIENYQLEYKDGVCRLGLDGWSRTAILEQPSNPFVDDEQKTLEDSYILETLKGEYEFEDHIIRIVRLEQRKQGLPFPFSASKT
jgi:hypothetical protein